MNVPVVDGADKLAIAGASLVCAGAWGLWGWAVSALVLGALLIAAATARELRG